MGSYRCSSSIRHDTSLIATCEEEAACWDQLDGTLVDWSFSFRQAEVPDFESLFRDGHAELSVQQLGRWVVALHEISLTVFTRPAGSDTSD